MRAHPHVYEINTWPWLDELALKHARPMTLVTVPDAEWDGLAALGFDLIYLMGVWQRSLAGRRVFRTGPAAFKGFDEALPGWTTANVVGSPYSIQDYIPDPRIGTWDDLHDVRAKLKARGMGLVLDFVPNHTGLDHPWVAAHPEYYVRGTESDFRAEPGAFYLLERPHDVLYVAKGRDPYFPAWPDVAQLDYFNPSARRALVAELQKIAGCCDGLRCDMAMLVLNDIFARTWGRLLRDAAPPAEEFWPAAIAALPDDFVWIAEVYWDLEWRLQQLGFGFTYDKRLYDRLHGGHAADVRSHLLADPAYQTRSVRFLENHDEPRSVAAFGRGRMPALATLLTTLPGMRFFYHGQFEGKRVRLPVMLNRAADEPVDEELRAFYERVLAIGDQHVFHGGEWKLLDTTAADDDSAQAIVSYRWHAGSDLRVVVVNLGAAAAQGHVHVAEDLPGTRAYDFVDQLGGRTYRWEREPLEQQGLYVRLNEGQAHIFKVESHS